MSAVIAYKPDTELAYDAGKHAVWELESADIPPHLRDLLLWGTTHPLEYIDEPEGRKYAKDKLVVMVDRLQKVMDGELITGVSCFRACGFEFLIVPFDEYEPEFNHAATVLAGIRSVARALGLATEIWG